MAALFGSPSAPKPAPLPALPAPEPDDEKRKARLEALRRRRRGRLGTIHTSARGLSRDRSPGQLGKTLLGE